MSQRETAMAKLLGRTPEEWWELAQDRRTNEALLTQAASVLEAMDRELLPEWTVLMVACFRAAISERVS